MKNLLIYKLIILNVLAVVWLATSNFQTKWFQNLFFSDTTKINHFTAGLFGFATLMLLYEALQINRQVNAHLNGGVFESSGDLWVSDIEWLERSAGWMLFLGLIGTLYGLLLSLSAVNTGNLATLEGIKQIAVQMMAGLRIELSTTIIGAIFSFWMEVNYAMVLREAKYLAKIEGGK